MHNGLFCLFAISTHFVYSQEIVRNSKGQSIKLNENKTWELVENSTDDNSKILETDLNHKNDKVNFGIINPLVKKLKNGEEKDADVKISFMSEKNQFDNINVDKLNKMIQLGLFSAKLKLKNQYSFIPREIKIFFSEKMNIWTMDMTYTAKNSYGGEVEGTQMFFFKDSADNLYTMDDYPDFK